MTADASQWPRGESEMAAHIREFDWAATPLGPTAAWPQSLKAIVDLMLRSPGIMSLVWGPEAIHLYNDGFIDLLREHPFHSLGRSAYETFARSRDVFAADVAAGMAGRSARLIGQRYPVLRNGRLEQAWFDVDYAPVQDDTERVAGVLWTLKETTAQHLAERALRESETRHRLLVESWAQAVWETNGDGVVVADSPSWRAYTGQTLEEWLGYGWLDAIHPDDRAYAERQWREAVAARKLVDAEFRLRAPDGGWRWTNVHAAPLLDASGALEKWIGVNIDIDARKRSDLALRRSEAKYRTIFESIDEGFLIHEMIRDEGGKVVDLRLLEANAALTRMTGLGIDNVGKSGREFLPNLEHVWLEAFDRVARTGVPERFENYNESTERWYAVLISQVRGTDDQVAVVYDDVTARKRAEIAARESEDRQTFLLALSDALRPLANPADIQGEATRLLREQQNVGWCYYVDWDLDREIGLVLRDSAGKELPSLVGPHDVSDAPEFLRLLSVGAVLTVRDYARYESLPQRIRQEFTALGFRSMMAAPLVKEGRLIATLVVGDTELRDWSARDASLLTDVAERTWAAVERARVESELRESEERFQQFANASAAGLWIRDADTLAMEFVSPAVGAVYGVEADALLGDVTRWAAMIVPDDRDVALAHLEAARWGEVAIHEFRIQRPSDGAFRWIRNTDFPLHDDDRIARIGGTAEDVTESKIAAEHSAVLLAELQHRVRNIMALLRSITKRTGERAESVADYRDLMMGRLLAFARVQALLTRTGNVSVGIASLVHDEVSAQAQHEGQYVIEGQDIALSPKEAEVLTLAIHELATNAVKYGALSVPDGRVAVRWSTLKRRGGPWLSFDWAEEGAPARPESEPGAPRRRGFGSELIEGRIPYELRGRGEVSIEPGGARCHLEFPLQRGASILETGAPQQATVFGGAIDMTGEPDLTGRRILVVEDDYYLATDTSRALRGAGAEVVGPCATEDDAWAELNDRRPDAVVVDINLGQGPSFKLAETLTDRGIPFVFTTGYDAEVIPAKFEGIERLQKPIQLRQIVGAIAKLPPVA